MSAPNAAGMDRATAVRWGSVTLVMSTALCIGVTLGLFPSLIALNVEARGFDISWNGLLAAMPSLAGILVAPAAPRLIARLGTLGTFLLSTALAILAAGLFPFLPGLAAWFAIRFAMGVGMGIQWIASETWVNRLAAGPRRGMILSVYVMVLSAGLTLGPLVIRAVGIEGALPFFATASILALSCLPLLFAATAVPEEAARARPLPLLAALARKPSAMAAALADGFVFQTLLAFLPLYFIRLGSPEETALGFLATFCLGGLVLQLAVGALLDRLAPARVLILCCGVLAATLALAAEVRETDLLAFLVLGLMGGGSAGLFTAGLAGINDAFSAAEMPSGTAVFTMLWYLGGLAGPMLAGAAMEAWTPYGMAATVATAATLVALVNLSAMARAKAG